MWKSEGRVPSLQAEGIVESVNQHGFKVGGEWVNVSRFHPVDLPETGAHVRVRIDSKGYIVDLENLSPSTDPGKTPAVLSAKDDRITKLAVLKAAAEFLGQMSQTREEVRSEHVLVLADKWLKWALAEED